MLDPAERLRQAAQDLDGLLVLDNCEHLLDAAAAVVADLLDAASPDVVVLATSRAPLGLVGEAVHRLRMLPDEDALGLLEARARAGRPGLTWDRERALELCHRLDNLPLALELAAARLRSMPVEDVLDGLSDRFALLDDALRGLPERHASLWAMVDWSRELLAPAERTLLARLAVVAGSFTAETAVRGRRPAGAAAVRRGLAVLVEQSLLTLADQDEGPARYRMLETVREYGEARLDAAGDRPAAMAGLVRWAAARAVRLGADFVGPAQVAAFDACARDQEALLVAARWAADHDDEPAPRRHPRRAVLAVDRARRPRARSSAGRPGSCTSTTPRRAGTSALLHGAPAAASLPNADRAAIVGTLAAMNGGVIESLRLVGDRVACLPDALRDERGDEMSARVARAVRRAADARLRRRGPGPGPPASSSAPTTPTCRRSACSCAPPSPRTSATSSSPPTTRAQAYERFEAAGDHWGMGMAAQGIGQWGSGRGHRRRAAWLDRGVRHLETVGAMQDARSIRLLLDVQRAIAGQDDALRPRRADGALRAGRRHATSRRPASAWPRSRGATAGSTDAARHADSAVGRSPRPGSVRVAQAHVVFLVAAATIHLRAAERRRRGPSRGGRRAGDAAAARAPRPTRWTVSDMPVLGSFALGCAELAAARGPGRAWPSSCSRSAPGSGPTWARCSSSAPAAGSRRWSATTRRAPRCVAALRDEKSVGDRGPGARRSPARLLAWTTNGRAPPPGRPAARSSCEVRPSCGTPAARAA